MSSGTGSEVSGARPYVALPHGGSGAIYNAPGVRPLSPRAPSTGVYAAPSGTGTGTGTGYVAPNVAGGAYVPLAVGNDPNSYQPISAAPALPPAPPAPYSHTVVAPPYNWH